MGLSGSSVRWQRVIRLLGALTIIVLETVVCAFLLRVNPTTVGFLYLVTILIVAMQLGMTEAACASLLATVCFNFFFLPPLYTFTIADPENWVALFTFLVASLLTSRLSERAKRQAAEALSRQQDLERLHAVSSGILLTEGGRFLAERLALEIARIYGATAVAIYDGKTQETFLAGESSLSEDLQRKLRDSALHGGTFRDTETPSVVAPFGLDGKPAGSLVLTGVTITEATLESLTNLVAIGLQASRNQEAANRAEAARQTEEFKSTLLEALAHDFKTPLTTIKAAASAMLEPGIAGPDQQRDYSAIIEQEADRLSTQVTEALHLARIEAGKMRLEKQPSQVQSLIEEAIGEMEISLRDRRVDRSVSGDLPPVLVDQGLLRLVLRQLLDNAVKYSRPHSPIRVGARHAQKFVWITVRNEGEPVPAWEREKLFERYYRGSTAGLQSPGTGMGLAIAKEIMSAHGGAVRLESSPEQGTEVSILLPVAVAGVPV